MSTFEQERRSQMIDIATYRQIKETCLGLVAFSGVTYSEKSDYDEDFELERDSEATFGVFAFLRYKVRVAIKATPENNHEQLLITTKCLGVRDGSGEVIYARKASITVINDEVRHSSIDLFLPNPGKTPEKAQPLWEVDPATREDFDLWKHELIGKQFYLDPESAQMLMTEINEITEL